jgi:hypothetical protein
MLRQTNRRNIQQQKILNLEPSEYETFKPTTIFLTLNLKAFFFNHLIILH